MISYFTDGSASPNPGPGGFAVIKNGQPYIIGGEPEDTEIPRTGTTNIRMEAFAIMNALDDFLDNGDDGATITTDSEFWINVLTKWASTWARNDWQKKGGVKNLDIVKPLFEKWQVAEKLGMRLIWTRGHVGTELNELADQWANKAREMKLTDATKVAE